MPAGHSENDGESYQSSRKNTSDSTVGKKTGNSQSQQLMYSQTQHLELCKLTATHDVHKSLLRHIQFGLDFPGRCFII